jgi:hypothetical protein
MHRFVFGLRQPSVTIAPPVARHLNQPLDVGYILLNFLHRNEVEVVDYLSDVLKLLIKSNSKHRVAPKLTNVPACQQQGLFDRARWNLLAQLSSQR